MIGAAFLNFCVGDTGSKEIDINLFAFKFGVQINDFLLVLRGNNTYGCVWGHAYFV